MKDRIINVIIIIIMSVVVNYPMYSSLKKTSEELNSIIIIVQDEVINWKGEIISVRDKLDGVRAEKDSLLNKIKKIESSLNKKMNLNNILNLK